MPPKKVAKAKKVLKIAKVASKPSPKKPSPRKPSPKKARPSKPSPKKASPSKPSPKKASPSKPSPKKASPSKPSPPSGCAIVGRKCENGQCCQSKTATGEQCTRLATYQVDLTKGIKIMSFEVCPKTGCCFLCSQHFKKVATTGIATLIHKTVKMWATSKLDYDEYYSIFQEEDPLRG